MKTISTKAIVLILILFAVYSCEKEENHETIISELEPEKQELSNVSSKDIPKVMNFLRQDGKSTLDFPVYRNGSDINKSDNEDLILTTIELNNIKKLTNSQGLSNYSFQLTFDNHQNLNGYTSIFNLVAKELSNGEHYSYIQEFRVENSWLLSNNLQTDMPYYTGFLVFYNTNGEFVINLEMSSGALVNYEETSKCDAGDGTGSGSGGGSGAGPGDGGNGSISDGGSSPGTGGPGGGFGGPIGGIGWYCYHRGEYHQSPDFCNHPEEGGQWVIKSLILKEKGENLLKNGCVEVPEECFNDVQDPCECDGSGGCVEENDEVPVNVFPISIALVHELNSLLDEGLLPSQVQAMGPYGDEFFQQMIDFLNENPTIEAQNFIHAVAETIEEVGSEGVVGVDFEDYYISVPTPDDNFDYQGPKENISNPIILSNGDMIDITFGTTKDNVNADQPVSVVLIDGLKFALEQANSNLPDSDKILNIYIKATTNGHGPPGSSDSNHLKASALDISRINGSYMINTGVTNQIIELQKAFDSFEYIRENFGPYFKHKFSMEKPLGSQWNYDYPIGGHRDHIHIAVRK